MTTPSTDAENLTVPLAPPPGMIEFGGFLEAECGATGVSYFDGSVDFHMVLERAQRYLLDAAAA